MQKKNENVLPSPNHSSKSVRSSWSKSRWKKSHRPKVESKLWWIAVSKDCTFLGENGMGLKCFVKVSIFFLLQ